LRCSTADLVALNKCDHAMAHTAKAISRPASTKTAKADPPPHDRRKHLIPLDALFAAIAKLGGLDLSRGGEKACHMPAS